MNKVLIYLKHTHTHTHAIALSSDLGRTEHDTLLRIYTDRCTSREDGFTTHSQPVSVMDREGVEHDPTPSQGHFIKCQKPRLLTHGTFGSAIQRYAVESTSIATSLGPTVKFRGSEAPKSFLPEKASKIFHVFVPLRVGGMTELESVST